jgi:hypothetical protein
MAVLAIGGDDGVLGRDRLDHADRVGLLADIEMQEAADLAGRIELGARLLEASDARHLPEEMQRVLTG